MRETGAVSHLVTVTDLRPRLSDLTVLDVRWRLGGAPGRDDHVLGRIPGSVFVDLDADLTGPPGAGRHPLPDPAVLQERMAALGYIDDRAFAEARARSMARRGLGARRVAQAFHAAGIAAEDAEAVAPDIAGQALDAALALARRRRIGPFAAEPADRAQRERQLAQMMRGGHSFALARRIVEMAPGEPIETLSVEWD